MNAPGKLLVAVLACLPACGRGARDAAAQATRPPRPVQLVAVGTAELPRKVAVSGLLVAQEELVVSLEVAGRLEMLAADVGDVVAANAVIASLAPREFELEVARAEASIVAAQARLGTIKDGDLDGFDVDTAPAVLEAKAVVVEATLHRDRIASMVQEQLRPAADLETAEATYSVAVSRLQRARDEVRTWLAEAWLRKVELLQAQKRSADSVVKAPWAGRIAQRHVVAGQVLAAGAPVVTLLRIDPLRLRMRVPDRLAMGIAIGQTVEFTVDGEAAQDRTGRVVRTGPAIDRGDRTRLVEAEVGNGDGALLPGSFCRAQIVVAPAVPVLVVPRSAVVTFAGVDRVFTVEQDKAGAVKAKGCIVELGRAVADTVEVVRGLAKGTQVVRDATGLSPETPVVVE